MMLLGALSVLMLGVVPTSATMSETAACHEAMTHEAPSPAPASDHGPKKAMAAMACCVSCVTAPAVQPPIGGPALHSPAPDAPAPVAVPAGLSLAPETGPPKG